MEHRLLVTPAMQRRALSLLAACCACSPAVSSFSSSGPPPPFDFRLKGRAIRVADVGTPDATRIHNYMQSSYSWDVETFHDYLLDEAVVASLDGDAACFDLVIRSDYEIDIHPSQWEIDVNGRAGRAEETTPVQTTFWTTEQTRNEVVMERGTDDGWTQVTRPVTRDVRKGYAVRQARACAPRPLGTDRLRLVVKLPSPDDNHNYWGQTFEWTLGG